MTTTVTDQRTLLDDCDVADWSGADTLFTTDPTPSEASGCLGFIVSTETESAYDTVTSDNWSGGGTFSLWARAYGTMDTTTNGGIQMLVGDGTDRVGFHVAGSDKSGFKHNEGPVEWQCLVMDPLRPPIDTTLIAGTEANLTLTAVTNVGIVFKTLAKSVGGANNCFVDILRWADNGVGITARGGTTSGAAGNMSEVAADDRSIATLKALGVVHELATGVYGIQGNIILGDSTNSSDQYWSETNVTYAWEDRGYSPENYYRFTLAGSSTATNIEYSFISSIFTVPEGASALFDANDANITVCTLTGCTLIGFDQGVDTSQDTGDSWLNCTYIGCGSVIANGCDLTGSTYSGHQIPITQGQTQTSYDNSPTTEGTFTVGTGYAASDTIRLSDGSLITVNTVSGSAVATFTVTTAGYGIASPNTALTQENTSGAGTGFTLTPDEDNFAESSGLKYNLTADPDGELDNSTFTMGDEKSHAIEFGTNIPSEITLRGMDFNGYSSSNSVNDSVFHFLDTTGTITVNLIGCTNDGSGFTYNSEGAIINLVIAPKTTKITCENQAGTSLENVRVFLETADNGGGSGLPYQAGISSITRLAGIATLTASSAHGLSTNDKVVIRGASPEGYNKTISITILNSTTFAYLVDTSLSTPATVGSAYFSYCPISGLTNSLGVIQSSKTWPASQGVTGWARKSTASPYYKESPINIADASGGTDLSVLMILDE